MAVRSASSFGQPFLLYVADRQTENRPELGANRQLVSEVVMQSSILRRLSYLALCLGPFVVVPMVVVRDLRVPGLYQVLGFCSTRSSGWLCLVRLAFARC